MKTIVCLFSHLRTFRRCLPTQHFHLLRHLLNPDFVVFTIADRDAETAHDLKKFYPKARVEIGTIPHQPELPIPVPPTCEDWTQGRIYSHEPYAISVHPQAVLKQLWQLEEGWKWAKSIGIKPEEYDVVVRLRPDSWFRDMDIPDECLGGGPMITPRPFTHKAFTPWWGRFGGVNDRLAIMGHTAAAVYFTTYGRIPKLIESGCPLHPESLVKASLESEGCVIDDTLWAMFAKLYPLDHPDERLRGSFREPEITTEDLAHYAGRAR